ncbi:MAG: DUF3054 domain-containing protein [Gordonia sp. (in: high G+C Gram-positive bacteria)]|uniref:DUF3054 domain-containing protein n=1 Tax=Gordonia sp. (in: high G+C Gram-positive bacteria) TaxID=84139 RepID=UPI003C723616
MSATTSRFATPLVADVVAIAVFTIIGRASHEEALSVTGFLTTFWPFLVGTAIGWVITAAVPGGRSFAPAALWPAGVVVWISTVVFGMVLRAVSGQGTALPFVIVATLATGLLLLGWRAVALAVSRRTASSV